MASNSTKSFLADAGYGEQELDANSALMELDKGRGRSGRSVGGGTWRHPAAAAGDARRARALLCGAGSAAAPAGLLDWPGTAVPVPARTLLTTWGHSLPISQTVNEIISTSDDF